MPLAASALALQLEREGRQAIRRELLPGTVRRDRKRDDATGREHWVVADPQPIVVPRGRMGALPGEWFIRMAWDVFSDPAGGDAQVLTSSISLNVANIPLTESLDDQCLVRYDTDFFDDAPSRIHSPVHLNVLQPERLGSSVHYPIMGLAHDRWPLEAVLRFFLSAELQADLAPLVEL